MERLRQLPEDIRGILVVPDGSGTVAVAVAGVGGSAGGSGGGFV